MSTIEQKVATLRARWFELHPTKPPAIEKEKPKRVVRVPPELGAPYNPANAVPKGTFTKEMFESLKLEPATVKGEKPTLIQQLEDSIVLENLRKFVRGHLYERGMTNNSPYLRHLKNVEWVANIAIGIDKRTWSPGSEWWCVCPPVGVMISYVGNGAKERAIVKANELKEYY